MHRLILFAMGLLLLAVGSPCQTTTNDLKILQDLLAEVRQLRQDLHTTSAAVQRAQILLHRVDTQEYVVRSLRERVDSLRSNLERIRADQKTRAERIKQGEDQLNSDDTPQAERKRFELALAQIKQAYQRGTNEEQEAQARFTEAEDQLRVEEAKLNELEAQLDRLDRDLETAARGH